jgi:16S rRNA (cytidine1402-2'-O)-methyltransferase
MIGTLYLLATPIGNLADISFRAVETLKTVDLIACEDTRHSRKLLNFYQISNKLISYHEHNEIERSEELARLLLEGKNIAVISDAGTPGICDPSFRLVQKAHDLGAKVVPIPGPVAFVNALIVSGLPTDSVFFGGFLPSKQSERIRRLQEIKEIPATICFYESPHRLLKSLTDCLNVLGNRPACIVRELTKIHEEVIRGDLNSILENLTGNLLKGEFVLLIDRYSIELNRSDLNKAGTLKSRLTELESSGLERKSALKKIAKEFGLTRSEVYRRLLIE